MTREWIALERHEGRAGDLSLYARALHAQLHRWVDGEGRIPARLDGDLVQAVARSLAFRFGARRSDRRLLVGHLQELVVVGAVVLSPDGLELRALADGADLVRHRLAIGDRPSTNRSRPVTTESRTVATVSRPVTTESRTETKTDLSARNSYTQFCTVEESRREEKREEESRRGGVGESAPGAPAPSPEGLVATASLDSIPVDDERRPVADSLARQGATLSLESDERPSVEVAPTVATTAKPTRTRRVVVPPTDTVPLDGTPARRVYEAIVSDVALAPIVRGPGDLSQRLDALCDGTSVDPASEVISAGAWLLRNPGKWRDGASGLIRWVRSSVDRARAVPAPVVGVARPATNTRTDYQGRTVAGPAALPSGDVWTSERDEETEALERIRQRTQPRGASR